jgi:hypothetical protein
MCEFGAANGSPSMTTPFRTLSRTVDCLSTSLDTHPPSSSLTPDRTGPGLVDLCSYEHWMQSGSPTLAQEYWDMLSHATQVGCVNSTTQLVDFSKCARDAGTRDIVDWPQDARDGYVSPDMPKPRVRRVRARAHTRIRNITMCRLSLTRTVLKRFMGGGVFWFTVCICGGGTWPDLDM